MRIDFRRHWPVYLSLLAALAIAGLPWATPEFSSSVLGERGLIERVTALLYLAAALLAALALVRADGAMRLHAAFWILLSAVCFGEETSWLQHEIGFATPAAIEAMNVQNEFNLHNLEGLHGGKILGEDAVSPALGALLSAQNVFQLGFAFIFLALPVLARMPVFRSLVNRMRLPYPGGRMMAVIWTPILVALLLAFATEGRIKDLAAETREMLYAAAFLLFTGTLAASLRGSRRKAG